MYELCYKAHELNSKVSHKLFYSPYLYQYQPESRRFVPNTSQISLLLWYITGFLFSGVIWGVSCIYEIIYRGMILQSQEYNRLFFSAVLIAPYLLTNGMNIAIFKRRRELAQACNVLYALQDSRFPSTVWTKSTTSLVFQELRKFGSRADWNDIDGVGLLAIGLVLVFSVGPLVFYVGALITGIEPITLLFRDLFYFRYLPENLVLPCRFFTASIATQIVMEASRVSRVVFVMVMVNTKFTHAQISEIWRKSEYNLDGAMRDYRVLYSVHVQSFQSAGALLFVAVECGMLIAIMSLAGTVVGWKIFPIYLYWLCPFMGAMSIMVILIALPYAAKSAERSEQMVKEWKFRVGMEWRTRNTQIQLKTLRAFEGMAIAFWTDHFGWLTKKGKNQIVSTIILNTIDAVLMFSVYRGGNW